MHEFLVAVTKGDRPKVKALLSEDPSLANLRTDAGVSAVLMAVYYQEPDIARDLVGAGADIGVFEAAALGNLERTRELIGREPNLVNAYAADGFQPLGLACFFGHPDVADFLLDSGADPNSPSRNSQRVAPLHSAVASRNLQITQALLERGADVNAKQEAGYTPLHEAAHNGDLPVLDLLLHYGADPLARNDAGQTPLDIARDKGHHEIAGRLHRQ